MPNPPSDTSIWRGFFSPRLKRLSLGSGTDVKSQATFSSGPDPSERPRRNFCALIKKGSQPNTASPNCLEYDRAVPHATRGRDGRQEGRERSYYHLHCYLNNTLLHLGSPPFG